MLHLPSTGSLPAELGTQKDIAPSTPISSAGPCLGAPCCSSNPRINPPSSKSFRAVCAPTLSKRPRQDGAVTRLKDITSGAPRLNGLI